MTSWEVPVLHPFCFCFCFSCNLRKTSFFLNCIIRDGLFTLALHTHTLPLQPTMYTLYIYTYAQILHPCLETWAHNCASNTSQIFLILALHTFFYYYIQFEVEFTLLIVLPIPLFVPRIFKSCFGKKTVNRGKTVSKCKPPIKT
jgi:hypothetical protein